MDLGGITPVILSWNEAPNIGRTLAALGWAREIIVLDSGSDDATAQIVAGFANARLHTRRFDTHATQWNHALELAQTDWVLSLDADYQIDPRMPAELAALDPAQHAVWYARFRFLIAGKPVRGALLPPRAVLFRRSQARYVDDGHTQRLGYDCSAGTLDATIDHDDRKPLRRWLSSQIRYAELECDKLMQVPRPTLGWPDRIRRWIGLAPVLVFVHVYLLRGAVLSGRRGLFYAGQRVLAELMLSLLLLERKLTAAPIQADKLDGTRGDSEASKKESDPV